jgi:hypothetical protein
MSRVVRGLFVVPADRSQINFFPEASVDWTSNEKLELERLRDAYPSPQFEMECDSTEDGDPWCVVSDPTLDRVIVHIARIERSYVVIFPERNLSKRVAQLRTAVDLVVP